MNSQKKHFNLKNDSGSVTLFVLIAMIFFLIVCFFIYTSSNNKKVSQMRELEQLKKNYESTAEEIESKYESITGDTATNVNLTSLVTGEDVSHTHVYEKKYDDTSHWEECFICGDTKNQHEHNKTTSGTGSCGSYYVEYCTDGCGYSISTYVEHEIEYFPQDNIYDEKGSNTNQSAYNHGIGICKNCGAKYAYSKEGSLMTRQDCVDENGNKINCANRKKCVYCGFDYSKVVSSYHPHIGVRNDGITYYCKDCNLDIYKTYYNESVQDTNNNLHWTLRGIYQLLGKAQWYSKEDLPTWSTTLDAGAFEKLESANVIDLPSEYYNNPQYGTQGITSGLYLVQFEAYIKNGYQGTPVVSLNASMGLNYINGNLYEYARPNQPLNSIVISPDTQAPTIDNIQINKTEIINGFSKKATIIVDCSDSYSDVVDIALYDTQGNCLVDYGTATNNGNKTFTRTFDIAAEATSSQTLVVKAKDRYGNESTKNIEIQSLDAKAPTLINNEDYTSEWSKNKKITFKATDSGVGEVQIAFNNVDDYQLAEEDGNVYTRTYNFYGDIYDKVTAAIYLKDALGNEQMVKVDIGKLDNTAPTITKSELVGKKVILEANDRHETLGEGSGVAGYRYVTSSRDMNKRIMSGEGTFTEASEIDISNMDNVKYLYIAPVDKVGNIGQTIKIELPT